MIDLTEDQMLGMARIAGLHMPDEDVVPLTLRLNALLEASEALDQFPLEGRPGSPHTPSPLCTAGPAARRSEGRRCWRRKRTAPLAYKPITELAHLIRTRHLSPVELTDLYLERIDQYNDALKSYITVVPESARREAQEAERALKQGCGGGPPARHPFGLQGRVLHERCAHHLRLCDPVRVRAGL